MPLPSRRSPARRTLGWSPGARRPLRRWSVSGSMSPCRIVDPRRLGVALDSAVVVRDLRKSYGEFEAVRGISFEVARGEAVAFLGPNGAGKTTTVEILEGLRAPSAGSVSVLGV